MTIRQTVLQEGMNIFQRHGIKNLTMEEIISELKISKGTLFEIAASKEALLEQCIEENLTAQRHQFSSIMVQATNPLQALQQLLKSYLQATSENHSDFLPDLKTYHKPCWEKLNKFKATYLEPFLQKLLESSIEAGLLQKQFNAEMVGKILLAQMNSVSEAGLFHTFKADFNTVFEVAFGCYLKGLATSKGVSELQNPFSVHLPSLN